MNENGIHIILHTYLIPVSKIVLILALGWVTARLSKRSFNKIINRSIWDDTTIVFVGNLLYYAILVGSIVLALNQVGIGTNSIAAVLGAGVLSVGLALKNHLSNCASGFILIIARPYSIGEYIMFNNQVGQVQSVKLFFTGLRNLNHNDVFIPNAKITSSEVVNLSRSQVQRLSYSLKINNTDNITPVKNQLLSVIDKHPFIVSQPKPVIVVESITDQTYQLIIHIWVHPEHMVLHRIDFVEDIFKIKTIHYIDVKKLN